MKNKGRPVIKYQTRKERDRMATKNDKQGYVMYRSWNPVLLSMTDDQLGQVFRAVIQYQEGLPVTNPPQFFEIIRYSFIQDEQRYDRKCEDNRRNRMIANLKGLKPDVLRAQLDMIDLKDLQAIAEKAKDHELRETLILELHRRTQVTNVTRVTSDTVVTNKSIDTESESDSDSDKDTESDKDSEKEKESDKDLDSGTGEEIEMGVQGEKEEPHLYGNYQNIVLTDSEWTSLIKQFGMNRVDDAINSLSYSHRMNGERTRTGHYQLLIDYLNNNT